MRSEKPMIMCSIPSLRSIPNVAFETVPVVIWPGKTTEQHMSLQAENELLKEDVKILPARCEAFSGTVRTSMTGRSSFQVLPVSLMITWTDSMPFEKTWLTEVAAICVFNPWTFYFIFIFYFYLHVLNPSVAFLLFMRVQRIDCVRLTGS